MLNYRNITIDHLFECTCTCNLSISQLFTRRGSKARFCCTEARGILKNSVTKFPWRFLNNKQENCSLALKNGLWYLPGWYVSLISWVAQGFLWCPRTAPPHLGNWPGAAWTT